jgi:DNA helicase-2/ATP-dependent DNA helicase PcrA
LERIINEPKRGIGDATLKKWTNIAKDAGLNCVEAGAQSSIVSASQVLERNKLALSKIEEIAKFCEFIKRMKEIQPKIALADFVEKVFKESGYEKMLLDEGIDGEARWENVKELVSVAQKYDSASLADKSAKVANSDNADTLSLFLEEVALASDVDNVDQNQDAVHMMTLHSAKGLEFPVVFIVGLEEGILPHSRSMLSYVEMEEERRLMYVGLTRAKENIFLLFTRQRTLFGSTQMNSPSRFLEDIPEKLVKKRSYREIEQKMFESLISKTKKNIQASKIQKSAIFKGGEHVHHAEFGDGLVVSVVGDIITVAFKKSGIKRLSAEFAKLKII